MKKNGLRKVTLLMDPKHKWYLEELAHASRLPQREILSMIIDAYVKDHPLFDIDYNAVK